MSLDFYASASLQHPVVLMVSFYEFENWISSLKNRLQYIFERERDSVFWNFLIYRTAAKKRIKQVHCCYASQETVISLSYRKPK